MDGASEQVMRQLSIDFVVDRNWLLPDYCMSYRM